LIEHPYTQRRLETIVDDALRSAGALGTVPTPLEAVRPIARIQAVRSIEALPPSAGDPERAVLGAFSYADRTLYVDERQSAVRRRFTEAHELVHALCPWHEAVLRLDTEAELFRPVAAQLEREANAGAGLLIFQGRSPAGAEPLSISRSLDLAAAYGASAHATLHHLVVNHPGPAALLVVGRFPCRDGSLPIWRTIRSPAFGARLPSVVEARSALRELVEATRRAGRAAGSLVLADRHGRRSRCTADGYYNRHTFPVLVTKPALTTRRSS
jgi:IrrE N-terminal-like domain